MSQEPSPAVPPPPPGGENGPRLPWEEIERLGVIDALLKTMILLLTAPADAFSAERQLLETRILVSRIGILPS